MRGLSPVTLFMDVVYCRNVRGFHSGDYEEWGLLGCYVVWLL
jgi:hypothetical protein